MTTPFQPLPCASDGGGGEPGLDVEGTLVCDVNAEGEVVGTALVEAVYDETGARTGTRLVSILDGTPYVPIGTVQPCREGCCPEPVVLCDVQPDGSSVQFIRTYTGDEGGAVEAADALLDGTPYVVTGVVGSCDPYRLCTPDASQDLAGDCGPGEPINTQIVLGDGVAPDSTVNDDPAADALCGGTWGPGPDPQPAPFPVIESFRNSTYDEPPFIDQGTPPYPQLTSGGVDPVGDGWLRVSDINSGTNGVHQVVTPFSNADNTTAGVTFAAHDGTTQGGDGLVFALTDGAEPGGQGAAIGGFGNLGLANWEGGYVAVVLDEYGQTCTDSGTGPNPGPGPFCTNTISIQTIGPNRLVQGPAGVIASAPLAPKFINQTTRTQPAKLITSVITEGGQTYVSASIDWNDGAGPAQYFNRVNVTPVAGPAPSTFRMAVYGGSGGGLRDIKEFRDLTAQAGGIQNWRAFPVVTGAIPACVTQVNVHAEVDITFVSDTQAAGNADDEAWFWLVNTATNTIIDRAQVSSLPSQVGTAHHLTLDSGLISVADLPNIRVYVGAETRDQAGDYGHLWENLAVDVTGTGCPVVPRRTLEISAVCPIPVTIVGGSGDDGGSAPAVFNAPATFEDAPICATVAGEQVPAFRREVRSPDGNVTFSFLGTDGVPITPDSWVPGPCGACDSLVLGEVCVTSTDFPGLPLPAIAVQDCDDNTVSYINASTGLPWPNTTGVVVCPPDNQLAQEILCDDGTNPPTPFRRVYTMTALGSVVATNETLDAAPYVLVGTAQVCPTDEGGRRDVEQAVLCDDNGPFIRVYQYGDDTGTPTGAPSDFTLAGAPYVTTGTVERCESCCPVVVAEVCLDNGNPGAIIRNPDGSLTLLDTVTGLPFVAADITTCPAVPLTPVTLTAQARLVVPGSPWTPGADVAGTLTGLSATVITGTMTVVDQNGGSSGPLPVGATVEWNVEDRNTLTGPQSITAAAASSVLVTWTQR